MSVGGIVVSIAAFQAVDPGSNPGWRITFFAFLMLKISYDSSIIYQLICSSDSPSEWILRSCCINRV